MGREAHEDPARRYAAAVSCGAIYVVIGLFGAAVTGLLTAFPKELVAAIAGLALLGTIGGGLAAALREEPYREAALITFLVTLSGVTVAGIGSAFWGVVAGAVALAAQRLGRAKARAGKDIAPACKIRLDDRAGAASASSVPSPADSAPSRTPSSPNPSSPTRP
jgi:benzoate membrane transport protein